MSTLEPCAQRLERNKGAVMSRAEAIVEILHPDRFRSLWTAKIPWHHDAVVMHQGTSWHAAGLVTSAEQRQSLQSVFDSLYPDGRRMTDVRAWDTEQGSVVVEWRDTGRLANGHSYTNGGAMLVEYEGELVIRLSNFTNTALLETVETEWYDGLPIDLLLHIPAFHTIDLPTLSWRPYPPSAVCAIRSSQPREFAQPLTNEDRIHRRYNARHLFKDIPKDQYYEMSPDGYVEFSGTSWHLAGHNTREVLADNSEAGEKVFSTVFQEETFGFSHMGTWSTYGDRWVFMEWISESQLRRGGQFRNHGLTLLHFDDDHCVAEHREYTNVAYLENVQDDVLDHVDKEAFAAYSCSKTWGNKPTTWSPLPIPAESGAVADRSKARATA